MYYQQTIFELRSHIIKNLIKDKVVTATCCNHTQSQVVILISPRSIPIMCHRRTGGDLTPMSRHPADSVRSVAASALWVSSSK